MNAASRRRQRRRRHSRTLAPETIRPNPRTMTFEFVKLRLGERCVPAVEVAAGDYRLIDELPYYVECESLRAWLKRQGLTEVGSR